MSDKNGQQGTSFGRGRPTKKRPSSATPSPSSSTIPPSSSTIPPPPAIIPSSTIFMAPYLTPSPSMPGVYTTPLAGSPLFIFRTFYLFYSTFYPSCSTCLSWTTSYPFRVIFYPFRITYWSFNISCSSYLS